MEVNIIESCFRRRRVDFSASHVEFVSQKKRAHSWCPRRSRHTIFTFLIVRLSNSSGLNLLSSVIFSALKAPPCDRTWSKAMEKVGNLDYMEILFRSIFMRFKLETKLSSTFCAFAATLSSFHRCDGPKFDSSSFPYLTFILNSSLSFFIPFSGKFVDRFVQQRQRRQLIANRHQNGHLCSIRRDDCATTGRWWCR